MTRPSLNNKLIILREIYERKDDLFGKYTSRLTFPQKRRIWDEIYEKSQANGASGIKSGMHLSQITWQNWQSRTKRKYDESQLFPDHQTNFTEAEKLILEIIGIQVDVSLEDQKVNKDQHLNNGQSVAPNSTTNTALNLPDTSSISIQQNVKRRPKFAPELEMVQLKKAKYRSEIEKNRAIAETAKLQAEVAKLQIAQLKSQLKN